MPEVTKKVVAEEKVHVPEERKAPPPKGTLPLLAPTSGKSLCFTFHRGEKDHSSPRTTRWLQMIEIAIFSPSYNLPFFDSPLGKDIKSLKVFLILTLLLFSN